MALQLSSSRLLIDANKGPQCFDLSSLLSMLVMSVSVPEGAGVLSLSSPYLS